MPFRGAWANLLRNYLESQNEQTALYDLGIDANTTKDLLARFSIEAIARHPQVIIFAIGANDSAYRHTTDNPLITANEFKQNITHLIQEARKITDKILFVGLSKGDDTLTTPLPRSATGKCYTKDRVRLYNDILKQECAENNVAVVDIIDQLNDEDFDDGLHPNLGGHQKIFEAVRRVLLSSDFLTSNN